MQWDLNQMTPSDYCVMGMHMEFESYDSTSIDVDVRNYFIQEYGVQVEYVNSVYDIDTFFQLAQAESKLAKRKALIDAFLRQK